MKIPILTQLISEITPEEQAKTTKRMLRETEIYDMGYNQAIKDMQEFLKQKNQQ